MAIDAIQFFFFYAKKTQFCELLLKPDLLKKQVPKLVGLTRATPPGRRLLFTISKR